MPHNLHGTLQTLKGHGKLYSLPQLGKSLGVDVARLPVSIRIVLESVLRNCDGKKVTEDHVRELAGWKAVAPRTEEIPFVLARIVLQDFTGVPLLVDLAVSPPLPSQLGDYLLRRLRESRHVLVVEGQYRFPELLKVEGTPIDLHPGAFHLFERLRIEAKILLVHDFHRFCSTTLDRRSVFRREPLPRLRASIKDARVEKYRQQRVVLDDLMELRPNRTCRHQEASGKCVGKALCRRLSCGHRDIVDSGFISIRD